MVHCVQGGDYDRLKLQLEGHRLFISGIVTVKEYDPSVARLYDFFLKKSGFLSDISQFLKLA